MRAEGRYLLPVPVPPDLFLAVGLLRARQCAVRALAADSMRPVVLQESGRLFGQEGGSLPALCYLRRSIERHPQDPQTAFLLAFAA